MIKLIEASDRHFQDFGWLRTCWLFSFDTYRDLENTQFGALRVFNDDVIAPGAGFPMHPHREMEIVTIVLDGELIHEDSTGNNGVIRVGEVQRMSAGTGILHSENNQGSIPVHLYQIWILPNKNGVAPGYDQKSYSPDAWKNRMLPLASSHKLPGTITINADATIYRCALERGQSVGHFLAENRGVFVYLTSGSLKINDAALSENDQARITKEPELNISASEDCHFVLIDVAL